MDFLLKLKMCSYNAEGDFSNNQCVKLTLLIDGSQKPSLKILTLSWKSQQTKLKKGDMYIFYIY